VKNPAKNRVRLAASAAALAVLAFGAAGCGAINQQATTLHYNASDGVSIGTAQTLQAHNLLLVTNGDKAPARLLGNVTNGTSSTQTFKVSFNGHTASTSVAPGKSANLQDDSFAKDFTFPGSDGGELKSTTPGLDVKMEITPGKSTQQDLVVPVTNGTIEDYAKYVPGGSNPDVRDHLEPSAAAHE